MSKVIMSMNGLCTWMALYHNTSSGQLCTRHCTPVGEDPQTNTMTSDKCLNEVETISSNEPNIFLNYSTLNSKHNRVTTQSRNQQNMHLPISTTESRPEVQFSCFRNLSWNCWFSTSFILSKSKQVEVGGDEKKNQQHLHSLLQPIPGQHMYDIQRSDQHVARTACYSLYSLCSCPVEDIILTHRR
jgi:hypothetical protein